MFSYLLSGFYLLIFIPVLLAFSIGFVTFGITDEDQKDIKDNQKKEPALSATPVASKTAA